MVKRFDSQHPRGTSQLSAITVPEDLTPLSDLFGHQSSLWYTYILVQAIVPKNRSSLT